VSAPAGAFAFGFLSAWIDRIRQRRRAKRAAKKGFVNQEVLTVDSLKGALKSKLVWLGVAQLAYSLFETWANGGLNAEAVSTAVTGALTIIFRAVTTQPLSQK